MTTTEANCEYDETETCWHLMVTTLGGKVSMLQNLDAPTARQAYRRLRPDQHPKKFINKPEGGFSWSGGMRHCSDGDIESVDILGPEGCELDPWRGVEPRIIDLEPERKRQEAERKRARKERERMAAMKTADDVLEEWYARCVAKYSGASEEAKKLYDGLSGRTAKRFANQHAPDGVHITQKDMERFLDKKGVRSRGSMFAKRYDGIQHIAYGDVRSGNYGT